MSFKKKSKKIEEIKTLNSAVVVIKLSTESPKNLEKEKQEKKKGKEN